jgi:deoxyribose-phosphate aldolase
MVRRTDLARMIDHTLLRAHASETDIRTLCDEALEQGFRSVSVNPVWVSLCAKMLRGTRTGIDACVGFPLGANTAKVKVEEAREAIQNGATEVDMVINIGALKSGYASFVEKEIGAVVGAVHDTPVKVILETCYLDDQEKFQVCEIALRAGAAYVKTSTGFGTAGATVQDIQLMRRAVGSAMGIKAAGGIRTYANAMAMIAAGANVIGTSAGVSILEEAPE